MRDRKMQDLENKTKLENVVLTNVLQLEAADAAPVRRFNFVAHAKFEVAQPCNRCRLTAFFYC